VSTTNRNFFLHASIPDVSDALTLYEDLASPPVWRENELQLPHANRRRLVARRLSNYFLPGARQLKMYEEFIGFVRDGYEGRGQTFLEYESRVREVARQHNDGTLLDDGGSSAVAYMTKKSIGLNNTAGSAVLLGTPGMGKTLSIEEILNRFPEVIVHTSPLVLKQVVWMKLDCPHKGSVKSLCMDFFAEMDRILEFDRPTYVKMYAAMRSTEEMMMSHMALIANLHALGVLVIDEVQHLSRSDGNLLKFLVTLINKIGVPVLLIGTTEATEIVRETVRLARRSVGQGSATWDRYSETDHDWIKFIDELWEYQWTNVKTELSDPIKERLYHHTQGILDLAVKLFMFAQLRAIRIGESSKRPEKITEKLIDAVARDDMAIVQPLMKALRSGDRKEIALYKDLSSFSDHVATLLQAEIADPKFVIPNSRPGQRGIRDQENLTDQVSDLERSFLPIFSQLGIGADVGRDLLASAQKLHPEADFFGLLETVRDSLKATPPKKYPKKAPSSKAPVLEGDLRQIVAAGREEGRAAIRSLQLAELAGGISYFRAAS
jgi:hypothetical protein